MVCAGGRRLISARLLVEMRTNLRSGAPNSPPVSHQCHELIGAKSRAARMIPGAIRGGGTQFKHVRSVRSCKVRNGGQPHIHADFGPEIIAHSYSPALKPTPPPIAIFLTGA